MCDSHTGDGTSLFLRSPQMSRLSDSQEILKCYPDISLDGKFEKCENISERYLLSDAGVA